MQQIVLGESEKASYIYSWFGEDSKDEQYEIVLEGDGAEVDVYGVFYGRESARYVNYVRVIHKGKNTRANVYACGIVVDRSFVDFSGMLRVERGAKGTRTFFRANLMILDKQASAHTFPGLEIEENEILQGGHAATVGKVNEEQMFYLMSRGLEYDEAKKMVIRGFFEPILVQLNTDSQTQIRKKLDSLL